MTTWLAFFYITLAVMIGPDSGSKLPAPRPDVQIEQPKE